ncbi:hypothetical protein A3841_12250 [Pontibacter flavimaris]|uniref:Uncharacterized protein n=1 Tax=Pontibacter flavimaris TaxID=1797110 RepID=A0A1Q5PEF3_9BACT|nr:hypothetical protein A3841_12250 [Pontibacter flavimaris]
MIGGTLAWAIKLAVIVATNGRIITSGAAAFFMATGIVLLLIGSTGIGYYLSRNRRMLVRAIAIILSPALVFGSFILIGMVTNPLLQNSSIWYAQQEAPIGVGVIVYMLVGYFLFRSGRRDSNYA